MGDNSMTIKFNITNQGHWFFSFLSSVLQHFVSLVACTKNKWNRTLQL